ncbi:metallopeptidase family protein [Nakamurella leprariae]|uniref:Metallopeptidase family protein n=1 Tax=Nakamurella leprariae TaxID=2803911 RepID=A0A938YBT8_9ACTN|nr:metallopeptidase family protein [Nakamurella leprariae]MBM9467732.1 metallopeptidase family protein [Nakamurella leprariae]
MSIDHHSGPTGARGRARQGRRSRDRHGRGLRGALLPADLPGARTRAEQFDQLVLDAVAELERRWPTELGGFEFAVDEVPPVGADGDALPSDDVVADGPVPLARAVPAGVDSRGRPTKPRIVIYRRPLEVRSADPADLADLVVEVINEQVGSALGRDPEEPPDA